MESVSRGAYTFAGNGGVKNAVAEPKTLTAQETLAPTKVDVDETYGFGFASYVLDLDLSKISNSFKSYSSLTNEEKLALPKFDNEQEIAYVSGETNYVFEGAYFISGENDGAVKG